MSKAAYLNVSKQRALGTEGKPSHLLRKVEIFLGKPQQVCVCEGVCRMRGRHSDRCEGSASYLVCKCNFTNGGHLDDSSVAFRSPAKSE